MEIDLITFTSKKYNMECSLETKLADIIYDSLDLVSFLIELSNLSGIDIIGAGYEFEDHHTLSDLDKALRV